MRFLSARRRHPLAGLLVLVLGLILVGGLYSALAPGPAQAGNGDEDLIAQGRELYLTNCSSCHGLSVEGTDYGPPLIGVGAAAVDFQVATGRMPAAQQGAQIERKPRVLDEAETEALAAYIASLGPGPEIPAEEFYNVDDASEEEIARGGELFRTNCTACHNFAGQGGALPEGRIAPTLFGVENVHIYEAMLTGPQQMPVFSDQVMTPEDKRDIIAYVQFLEEQPNPGGLSLGRLGPVSEGLWVWVVGMGALVVAAVWIGTKGVRQK